MAASYVLIGSGLETQGSFRLPIPVRICRARRGVRHLGCSVTSQASRHHFGLGGGGTGTCVHGISFCVPAGKNCGLCCPSPGRGRLFLAHWPFIRACIPCFSTDTLPPAMFVPIAAAAYSFIHHRYKAEATNVDRYLMRASAISVGYLALIILSGEVTWWLRYQPFESRINWRYFSSCFVGAIWAVGAAAYLAAALRAKSKASYYAGIGCVDHSFAELHGLLFHWQAWRILILLNARFTAGTLNGHGCLWICLGSRGWGGLLFRTG